MGAIFGVGPATTVPLWFQAQTAKQRQKPEEDMYYAAFGRFIAAYAMAEAAVHIATRYFSGMPDARARIVFAGIGLPRLFSKLKELVAATEHESEVTDLLEQMNLVGEARDQLVHRLVEYRHGYGFTVTNRLTSKTSTVPQPRTFTRVSLDDMEHDCRLIFARLTSLCGALEDVNPPFSGFTSLGMAGPWRFRPAEKPGSRSRQKYGRNKRKKA